MNLFLKRLKIVLQYNTVFLLLFLFITIYVYYFTVIKEYKSVYNNTTFIKGRIIDYSIDDSKLSLIIKAKEKVKATYYYNNNSEVLNNICLGCSITIYGKESDLKKNTIPNTFNYQKYLYNKKIYTNFVIEKYRVYQDNNTFYKIKDYFYKKTDKKLNSNYLKLFILGDKTQLDSNTYNNYQSNGIAHLFAISGMHIALIIKVLDIFLKRIKELKKVAIISFILLIYSFIVSFTSSVLRAILFYILLSIKKIFNIKVSNIRLLIICAMILIIINPFIIYDIGFIYSFIITSGIILNNELIKGTYFKKILIISIIAFIYSLPITINLNYEINILSIIYNVIFVPLVSLIIYPLTIVTFIISYFNPILLFFIRILEYFNGLFASFDTMIIIPRIPIVLVIIYYLVLLLRIKNYKKIILIILIMVINTILPKLDNNYYVNYLDVNQGDSIFLTMPNKKQTILIDTGGIVSFKDNESNYHLSNNYIKYSKSLGVNKIDYLIITHGDFDHMGEAINLVNNFKVEKVIFNCGPYNNLEKELIKILDKKKIRYYSCIKELNIDNSKLYFLQTKEYDNENDNSNVIYIELDGFKFMFMGDAGVDKEKDILERYNLSDIDVLKVGHHGSKTSSSKKFINEINPKYSIISVGKNNRYGHPNKEVLDNLEDSKTYRTDIDGSIMFKITNNKLKIETCSP